MVPSTFRTIFKPILERNQINYASEIILFGSCFSENIGKKLDYFKFKTASNPYGILFNPLAIENAIKECLENKRYTKNELTFDQGFWHSLNHHSDFSDIDSDSVLNKINTRITKTHVGLKTVSHLIITFGTSWIYELKESKKPVANCHKIPQIKFNKRLLSVNEIEESIRTIKKCVLNRNPEATIIFTVSPVRHIKDGMTENMRSKAHLLSAIHNSTDEKSNYFPSYEIMMDDLRDYRFYKEDMIHPNKTAIEYIWERFCYSWVSKEMNEIQKEIDKIQKGLSHKPFNPDSTNHKNFLSELESKINKLKDNHGIAF
jgi:hypothetical protein